MEHGSIIASAVGVGVGVGVGIGLVSSRLTGLATGGGATAAEVEAELRCLVVDGRDVGVSFDDFPYYLRFVPSSMRILRAKNPPIQCGRRKKKTKPFFPLF
jgi:hypothetical protein